MAEANESEVRRVVREAVERALGPETGTTAAPAPAPGADRRVAIGCDHGAPPTVRRSNISAIDKYVGAPNIEVAGQPVDGRSGGGLFTAAGKLIGVCNAADPQDNEGLYAGLETVHWQLDQIGQARIYQRDEQSQPSGQLLAHSDEMRESRPIEQPAASGALSPEIQPASRSDQAASVALLDGGRVLALDAPRALQSALEGRVFSVRTTSPRRAIAALRARPEVRRAALFGETVHATLVEPARALPVAVVEALAVAGAGISSMEPLRPSLEDVFLEATDA